MMESTAWAARRGRIRVAGSSILEGGGGSQSAEYGEFART